MALASHTLLWPTAPALNSTPASPMSERRSRCCRRGLQEVRRHPLTGNTNGQETPEINWLQMKERAEPAVVLVEGGGLWNPTFLPSCSSLLWKCGTSSPQRSSPAASASGLILAKSNIYRPGCYCVHAPNTELPNTSNISLGLPSLNDVFTTAPHNSRVMPSITSQSHERQQGIQTQSLWVKTSSENSPLQTSNASFPTFECLRRKTGSVFQLPSKSPTTSSPGLWDADAEIATPKQIANEKRTSQNMLWRYETAKRTTEAKPEKSKATFSPTRESLIKVTGDLWTDKKLRKETGLWQRPVRRLTITLESLPLNPPAPLWSKETAMRTTTKAPERLLFEGRNRAQVAEVLPVMSGRLWSKQDEGRKEGVSGSDPSPPQLWSKPINAEKPEAVEVKAKQTVVEETVTVNPKRASLWVPPLPVIVAPLESTDESGSARSTSPEYTRPTPPGSARSTTTNPATPKRVAGSILARINYFETLPKNLPKVSGPLWSSGPGITEDHISPLSPSSFVG